MLFEQIHQIYDFTLAEVTDRKLRALSANLGETRNE